MRAQELIAAGELDAARATLTGAVERLGPRAPGMRPWLLLELGTIARRAEAFQEAFDYLGRAARGVDAEAFANRGHGYLEITLLGELGRLHQKLGNLERARTYFERERAAAEGTDDRQVRQAVLLHSIRFASAAGQFGRAAEEAEAALARQDELRFSTAHRLELKQILGLARLYRAGDDAAAREEATALLREVQADPAFPAALRLPLLIKLARFERARGALDEAARYHALAGEELEAAARRTSALDASFDRAFHEAVGAQIDRARGAPPADLAARLASLRASYAAFLELWSSVPRLPSGVGFLQYQRRVLVVGEMLSLELAVDEGGRGVEAAFDALLQAQVQGSVARGLGARPGSLREVQEELIRPGEGLLVYLPAADGTHLFGAGRDGVLHELLPPSDALRGLRDDLVAGLLRPPPLDAAGSVEAGARARVAAAAEALAAELLPPRIRSAIEGWSRLTVVGADLLGWVPFECLPVEGIGVLGIERALAYLPSVPIGLELRRRAARGAEEGRDGVLLLASPVHSEEARGTWPELVPLELPDGALAALVQPFQPPGGRARVVSGPAAARPALEPAALRSVGVLEIVTHGVYDFQRDRPAGLILSPSEGDPTGLFWCEDAERLASPPLVLLAACGAGRAPLLRGEDGVGAFGGALLSAGARAVVLSPADLDLEATLELLGTFNAGLAGGASPAEAMRAARRRLAGAGRLDHPYFHSLLRVVGLGHDAPR